MFRGEDLKDHACNQPSASGDDVSIASGGDYEDQSSDSAQFSEDSGSASYMSEDSSDGKEEVELNTWEAPLFTGCALSTYITVVLIFKWQKKFRATNEQVKGLFRLLGMLFGASFPTYGRSKKYCAGDTLQKIDECQVGEI